MNKKLLLPLIALAVFSFAITAYSSKDEKALSVAKTVKVSDSSLASIEGTDPSAGLKVDKASLLYEKLNLKALKLNRQAFDLALKGYNKLQASGKIKNNLLTIVDFSQASTNKRMYIIDMKEGKILKHTHVAHGRNTGLLMANSFSNVAESYKSSLGFYVTSETYIGKHGLSLRLDGMEKNINDNARARAIVIHGADYANASFYKSTGYLGRSFGCPAVPSAEANSIINTIKNGSCLFLYSPDNNYLKQSAFIG